MNTGLKVSYSCWYPPLFPWLTLRDTLTFQAGVRYEYRRVSEAFPVYLWMMTWVQGSFSLFCNLLSWDVGRTRANTNVLLKTRKGGSGRG